MRKPIFQSNPTMSHASMKTTPIKIMDKTPNASQMTKHPTQPVL
jgi:hypothetical protein